MALVQPIFNNAPARVAGAVPVWILQACFSAALTTTATTATTFIRRLVRLLRAHPRHLHRLNVKPYRQKPQTLKPKHQSLTTKPGIALGSVMPPIAVAAPSDIASFMSAQFYVCIVIFGLCVLFYPEQPLLPPSSSAAAKRLQVQACQCHTSHVKLHASPFPPPFSSLPFPPSPAAPRKQRRCRCHLHNRPRKHSFGIVFAKP